jgi:magnesium-transporting ATPase (P-type)
MTGFPAPGTEGAGISSGEAAARLAQYGPNALPEAESDGLPKIFLYQFRSPFIYVLSVAALVSIALGQHINGLFIFLVLLLNAVIGTVQEYSAARAAAALRKMVPYRATVIRDGRARTIDTAEVVPGDYVQLVSGDRVPADLRLAQAWELQVDESMLTGESVASVKDCGANSPVGTPLCERDDCCFAGTVILRGRGAGVVTATGVRTEIGRIAADVGRDADVSPPLRARMERFTLKITYAILVLVALIFLVTVLRGEDVATVFLLGVALAVSAIPEGLPAAMTVALAIGMRRMAHHHVIIRRLLAVESLGSCTYIASDKTGTLTVNEMTIRRVVLPDGTRFDVSGEGLDLHGLVTPVTAGADTGSLQLLAHAGVLANEAELEEGPDGLAARGDGVDVALLVLADKLDIDYRELRAHCPELASIPYESLHAFAASVNQHEGGYRIFVKGSAERLLDMCSHASNTGTLDRGAIERQVNGLARDGYRVLALASRRVDIVPAELDEFLNDLEFIGIVGMIDPLRPEALEAVRRCHAASIKVAMVTGDHPHTARAIARQLGIAGEDMEPVTGRQIREAAERDPALLHRLVQGTRVFARIEPHQKKQIVEQLIADGEFVAVTGDGVNDAPALSQAHVGVAMGVRGTDVARESADIVLTDDNFSSIVEGIRQGRIVYSNIRKVIFLLISTGAAEIMLVLLSLLSGTPLPLLPIQLLWLNLVTNGIQDVALAFEPAEGDELSHRPRAPREPVFNRLMLERVIVNALVMGAFAFAVFRWQLAGGASVEAARNVTLLLMVLFENVHVLNSRSEVTSIFRQYILGNPLLLFGMLGAQGIHIAAMYTPGLRDILQITPVTIHLWSQLLAVALVLIAVDELHKLWHGRRDGAARY